MLMLHELKTNLSWVLVRGAESAGSGRLAVSTTELEGRYEKWRLRGNYSVKLTLNHFINFYKQGKMLSGMWVRSEALSAAP